MQNMYRLTGIQKIFLINKKQKPVPFQRTAIRTFDREPGLADHIHKPAVAIADRTKINAFRQRMKILYFYSEYRNDPMIFFIFIEKRTAAAFATSHTPPEQTNLNHENQHIENIYFFS